MLERDGAPVPKSGVEPFHVVDLIDEARKVRDDVLGITPKDEITLLRMAALEDPQRRCHLAVLVPCLPAPPSNCPPGDVVSRPR